MQFSILLLPLGAEGGARPQLPYSQRLQVRQRKSLWLLIATERDFQHVLYLARPPGSRLLSLHSTLRKAHQVHTSSALELNRLQPRVSSLS